MNAIEVYARIKSHLINISREFNNSLERNEKEIQKLYFSNKYQEDLIEEFITKVHDTRKDLLNNTNKLVEEIDEQIQLLKDNEVRNEDCYTHIYDVARRVNNFSSVIY